MRNGQIFGVLECANLYLPIKDMRDKKKFVVDDTIDIYIPKNKIDIEHDISNYSEKFKERVKIIDNDLRTSRIVDLAWKEIRKNHKKTLERFDYLVLIFISTLKEEVLVSFDCLKLVK